MRQRGGKRANNELRHSLELFNEHTYVTFFERSRLLSGRGHHFQGPKFNLSLF